MFDVVVFSSDDLIKKELKNSLKFKSDLSFRFESNLSDELIIGSKCPDLVILDFSTNEIGINDIETLKARYSTLNIIALDQEFDSSKYYNCYGAGASKCLTFQAKDWIEKLEDHIFILRKKKVMGWDEGSLSTSSAFQASASND